MLDITATLLAVLFSIVASFGAPTNAELGQSLALRDDAGVAVVSWDGETARVYRRGELQQEYDSNSWNDVMWNVNVPSYGTVTAPHRYDRALSQAEILDLDACDWPNETTLAECGLDAGCDCADQGGRWIATVR